MGQKLTPCSLPSALDPPQMELELKRMLGEYGRCYVKVKTNSNSGLRTAFVQFEVRVMLHTSIAIANEV